MRSGGACLGATAVLIAAVGCDEGGGITGLGDTFDPAATVQVLESVSTAEEGNVAAAHVSMAGDLLAEAIVPQAAAAPRLGVALREETGRGSAVEGRAEAPTFKTVVRAPVLSPLASSGSASAFARASLIPDTLEGRTFGLEGIGGYRLLSGAADAPAAAVRFLTYELDPLTGRPRRVPLSRAGHLDIREPASGSASRLELLGVRRDGGTELDVFLEVTVAQTETEIASDLTSGGSILDDDRRVDFALAERVAFTEGFNRLEITLSRQIEVPADGRSVTLEWEGVATGGQEAAASVTFLLTVADGVHAAVLEVSVTDTSVTGTLRYDGQTAAVVSGDPFAPTFSRPDGSPFPADESDALLRLLAGPDVALGFGERMLSPLTVLFQAEE